MPRENLLIVADSERNANMLYAVGMFVPEPFAYFTCKGRPYVLVDQPEFDQVRARAPHCRVVSYVRCERRLEREAKGKRPAFVDVLGAVLREYRIKRVTVAEEFPLGIARALRNGGVKVKLRKGYFFPQRAFKTADEVKKISAALVMAEVGMAEGIHALRRAKAGKNGRLVLNNVPLTSERLRAVIETAILQAGGLAMHTIVAGGPQGLFPHERGQGALTANQPIVLDIFPRSRQTGYFGDITRTIVRGRASETVRRMFAAVTDAQGTAISKITQGVSGAQIHRAVEEVFARHDFKTARRNGHMEGFFHGTGHGLGLEIHEPPRISDRHDDVLRAGHVVTVEPGLYYPRHGGVRLEDVVLVTRDAPRNLTKFEKILEI